MRANVRDTEIYFDVDGASLAPDGPRMREKPVAFVVHWIRADEPEALIDAIAGFLVYKD